MAFVGPDGSGKTTLLRATARELERRDVLTNTIYFGTKEPLLPTRRLARRLHERRLGGGRTSDRSRGRQSSIVIFLGTIHAWLDLWLRYLVRVRPALQMGGVVLTDRYFFDLMLRPTPAGLRRIAEWFSVRALPQPDLTLILMDDATEIHARNPELTAGEIRRQQKAYLTLLDGRLPACRIDIRPDANHNAGRIADEVISLAVERNA